MYLTRSSFLVNGKSVSRFLQTDLRNIQRLIETVSLEGAPVNVAALNAQLKMQLIRMIGGENSTKIDAARKRRDDRIAVDRNRDSDPIKCQKCGRNCQSRAVYCEMSNHWVHYNCEKLSKQEISEIENVFGLKYICKNCKSQSSTIDMVNSKSVCLTGNGHSQNINWESEVKSLEKKSVDSSFLNEFSQSCHSQNTQSKSLAEDILIEETSIDICSNCDEHIDGSDCQVCEVCDRLCHSKCLLKVDCCMVCYGCEASIKQMNTPQGVVAEDTVFAIDEAMTSTQNLISKNINCEAMASGGGKN